MSAFTEAEVRYLREQTLGRIATVGPDGQPHVTPVGIEEGGTGGEGFQVNARSVG